MITLIGTGHVFNLSQQLLNIFDEKQPNIMCVELDKQRFRALILKKRNPEKYKDIEKNLPIIYKMLARFQEGMANEYGVTAGQEMLTTIDYAKNNQLPVAFIDMNAQLLFKRMLQKMSFPEKIKLAISGFGGFFISKKRVEKEMGKLESNLEEIIDEIGVRFPTIKRVLIDERNLYMAQQLSTAAEQYDHVIAVIGDGHVPGISKLLEKKEIEYETIRLGELRKEPCETNSSTASFSIEQSSV